MPVPKPPRNNHEASIVLKSMGVDLNEAMKRDQLLSGKKVRNPFVCICGHGASSHKLVVEGVYSCRPSRMTCHCKTLYQVLSVPDTRVFKRMSNGYGADHALVRGIVALIAQGKKDFEFIPGTYLCHDCGSDENLIPALVQVPGGEIVRQNKIKPRLRGEVEPHEDLWLCPDCLNTRLERS